MNLELHILQNFAPSNLNRDDTGSPKDCEFGGFRRARISSQCLKRAVRRAFQEQDIVPVEHRAQRTKRLLDEVLRRLGKADDTAARPVVEAALGAAGFKTKDGLTQYLLFLAPQEIDAVVEACRANWTALEKCAKAADKPAAKGKKVEKADLPEDLRTALQGALSGGKAADLALFGRMLADLPGRNVDAACQVAHAISTHKVTMEFDYFTAVDDLKPQDTSGADMIGTVEFNSACFYRYANLDLEQLRSNLKGDGGLARDSALGVVKASVSSVPTGKQNSTAAQNPPSMILVVLRDTGLWSLANAFVRPVRPDAEHGVVEVSVARLAKYWDELVKAYGVDCIRGTWVVAVGDADLGALAGSRVGTVSDLIKEVATAIEPALA